MQTTTTRTIRKWGNAPAVRLPQKILEAAHLEINQELRISMRGRVIVLTPVETKRKPTLKQLLKDVTPDKVAGEFPWGPDVGKEKHE